MTTLELKTLLQTLSNEPAVLLYFYSDACSPCISLRPKVEELISKDYPKIQIIWVNSASNPSISGHFGVFSNPSMLLFFEGQEHRRMSKYISLAQLEENIRRPYTLIFEN